MGYTAISKAIPSVRDWDAIIIGGGIVGCATAYYAAKRGMRVLVIEKDNVAAAQSGRNLGFVRQQGRDFRELELMICALRVWAGLEAELGRNIGWRQGGNLALATTAEKLDSLSAWQARARDFGLDTRMVSRRQAQDIIPEIEGDFLGAMYTASDGAADPVRATLAFHDAARSLGAETAIGYVSELLTRGGQACGVRIGNEAIFARAIVCVAGAGTGRLLGRSGVLFPQSVVRATVVRTEPARAFILPCLSGPTTGIRQSRDRTIHLSFAGGDYDVTLASLKDIRWFRETLKANRSAITLNLLNVMGLPLYVRSSLAVADLVESRNPPRPNLDKARRAFSEFTNLLPSLKNLGILALWAGMIESSPDLVPAIGPVATMKGLLVASGFSGHGFGPAPMVGKILADLLAGGEPSSAIVKLSPDRFSNGTWTTTPDMY